MLIDRLAAPRGERLIKILCLPLLAWNLIHLGLSLANLPGFIQRVSTLTIQPYLAGHLPNPFNNQAILQAAAARGMSVPSYAVYYTIFNGILALFFAALAGLVLWKSRRQAFGWFAATVLLFLSPYPLVEVWRQSTLLPPMLIEAGSVAWPLVLLFFFVFPNGQVQPGWARWPGGVFLTVHLAGQVFALLMTVLPGLQGVWEVLQTLFPGVILVNFIFVLGCQVYRYRVVSTPLERQQTKVFLVGLGLMIATSLFDGIISVQPFRAEIDALTLVLVPLALAVSILRYRLWDIDLVIRRTLVYSILTAALGLVFYGGVTLLQWFFTSFNGQQSPVSIVISTLLIAALFSPLRRQVQAFIDRRFYRQKYNAVRALEEFSAAASREVELERLTGRLVNLVEQTVLPERVWLWMRDEYPPIPP